jgi:hypothetical protein
MSGFRLGFASDRGVTASIDTSVILAACARYILSVTGVFVAYRDPPFPEICVTNVSTTLALEEDDDDV